MKNARFGVKLAITLALLGGGSVCSPARAQGPSFSWAQTYSASGSTSLQDQAINIAVNETHAYSGGTRTNSTGNSAFTVVQQRLTDGVIRSVIAFPSFSGPFTATCMASHTQRDSNGDPVLHGDVAYIRVFVAGTMLHSSGDRYPFIAAFDINDNPEEATYGNLRLLWSWSVEEDRKDDVPMAITADANNVAMVSRVATASTGYGIHTRLFTADTGMTVWGPRLYTSSGAADDVPMGVVITSHATDAPFVLVGGHGKDLQSTPRQSMVAFAYNVGSYGSIGAGTFHGVSGVSSNPAFVADGTDRAFQATCATSGANSQANAGHNGAIQNFLAVAGRSCNVSSTADGRWMVDAFIVEKQTSGAYHVEELWGGPESGASETSFNDVPAAMCTTNVKNNYDDENPPNPIEDYVRLWVTGTRTPLSSGKSEVTTVQFKAENGDLEWLDHFAYIRSSVQRDAFASSISCMGDLTGNGYQTRAYVGVYVESTSGSYNTDFFGLKYDPEPVSASPPQKANMWLNSELLYPLSGGGGTQVSTGSISIRFWDSVDEVWRRKILLTGWRNDATTGDDFLTSCFDDDQ